jgi:hypothetical protein
MGQAQNQKQEISLQAGLQAAQRSYQGAIQQLVSKGGKNLRSPAPVKHVVHALKSVTNMMGLVSVSQENQLQQTGSALFTQIMAQVHRLEATVDVLEAKGLISRQEIMDRVNERIAEERAKHEAAAAAASGSPDPDPDDSGDVVAGASADEDTGEASQGSAEAGNQGEGGAPAEAVEASVAAAE